MFKIEAVKNYKKLTQESYIKIKQVNVDIITYLLALFFIIISKGC